MALEHDPEKLQTFRTRSCSRINEIRARCDSTLIASCSSDSCHQACRPAVSPRRRGATRGEEIVSNVKSATGVGAALVILSVLLPAPAPAQEYRNSTEHFEALKRQAKGGMKVTWDKLPDWTGIWTRATTPFKFDPAQPSPQQTTAQLTPEFARLHKEKLERVAKGIEWDPISNCIPPGYPRWLTEPFLREFVLRPEQT